MKKVKKILWGLVIILVVLVVAAVIVAGLFLGNIVKAGMEKFGPVITGVPITVDAVNVSLLTGSAKVKGLVVGNPQGYKTPQAISVGVAAVGVNPMSVLSDKIVVRSIEVRNPEITFEGNPLGGNNLTRIRDNVSGASASSQRPATNQAAPAAGKPGKKLEVDDFLITGAKVHVSLAGVGGQEMTLPLPDIHIPDLGKGPDGITATDLTRRVLDDLTAATVKAVANSAADISKGALNLGQGAGKTVGGDVNKITKGLGGLLKKSTN
ncbi:MAG: AsmA family protein [Verrucomicrobiota bacterium]|jgi:uncharacterized protein involved in outer membrane biogenesis